MATTLPVSRAGRRSASAPRRARCRWFTSAPAGAAGKVSIGFWDHWVPGGNDVMQKQVDAWAEKNKVEVQVDFITAAATSCS